MTVTTMIQSLLPKLMLAALSLAACANAGDETQGPRTAPAAPFDGDEPSVEGDGASSRAAPTPAVKDWRPWVDAEVARLRGLRGAWVDQVMTLQTRSTRAGFARMTGPLLRDPDAAPVLLHRLLTAGEPAEVRAAIVDALPRTGGDFSAAMAELIAIEPDARVRELMCGALQRAQAPFATAGLAIALRDASPAVRAEALRSLGARADDGADLADDLIAALADSDTAVQIEAARALGNLEIAAGADALVARLASPDAEVRRHSLRALSRVSPTRLRGLAQLEALRSDPDPKVARLAEQLATTN